MRDILFKDVAHLFMKCWGVVSGSRSKKFPDGKYAFSGELYHEFMLGKLDFKPFLRLFASITKEECIEYLSFYGDGKYISHKGAEILVEFHDETGFIPGPWQETYNLEAEQFEPAKRVVWMLSKHFDLFGLIEAGQALKA